VQTYVPLPPALSPAFAEAASRRQAPGERGKSAIFKLIDQSPFSPPLFSKEGHSSLWKREVRRDFTASFLIFPSFICLLYYDFLVSRPLVITPSLARGG
jgi:hypothetical protein